MWILPRWGNHRLDQIKPVAVEEWLDSIKRARGTRAKIRNLMSAIFHHAMRYEWVDNNPMKLVRQSAKREKVPDVLDLAELQLLLSKLSVRERTLYSTRQQGFGSVNCSHFAGTMSISRTWS
jgi:site-specific recombinase XerD